MKRAAIALGTALAGATLAAGSTAAQTYPGISSTEIKVGQTTPYSGLLSTLAVVSRANLAYFKMINDQGGINGRKINLISLDDAFSPPKTVEQTRHLVEEDQVSFIFQSMGTPTGAAVQAYLNGRKIPQLFQSTGGDRFNDPAKYPYSSHFSPSYKDEAIIYAKYIMRDMPHGKVALLYQHDDSGRDYQNGLRIGFGDRFKDFVVAETTSELSDPTLDSQVITLHASGANVLVMASNPRAIPQAIRKAYDIGWHIPIFIQSTTANIAVLKPAGLEKAVGVMGGAFMKDPVDQRWSDDPDAKAYRAWLAKYYPGADPADTLITYGYNAAVLMARILKDCGNDLSRGHINDVANHLHDIQLPMFLPGVLINTTPEDHTIVGTLQIVRFNGNGWDPEGGPVHK
jgi:branched-chain amino acid transport system substrate-binding protein